MNIKKASKEYESWLARQTAIVEADLTTKHTQMGTGPFAFLRATFYRWIETWPALCPKLAEAPAVLSVGDLHVENFGTWRDAEGRLIWGVNDFDEAYPLPYTNDLVRLTTSAKLALGAGNLSISFHEACAAILNGYTEALDDGGRPFVLAERNAQLRDMATSSLRDPAHFWRKMTDLPDVPGSVPASAKEAMERLLPEPKPQYRIAHRIAGLGSLGRQRFVALADWSGGKVAREAKALAPSACAWARGDESHAIHYQTILDRAIRCPDPLFRVGDGWIARRLAPDCSRIELSSLPGSRDESVLLYAMGWETANVHLGSTKAVTEIKRDLKKRPSDWLYEASVRMAKAVIADWKAWKAT